MILLPLIITGCRTTKIEKEIVLPPKPQRQELKEPDSLSDIVQALNYYEHLVQQWENWGATVEIILTYSEN